MTVQSSSDREEIDFASSEHLVFAHFVGQVYNPSNDNVFLHKSFKSLALFGQ